MKLSNITKPLSVFILAGCMITACSENEHLQYEEKARAYFSTLTETDSMSYSFASGTVKDDMVSIPVRIIGASVSYDRTISVQVDPSSTAQEGVHYSNLTRNITLKADSVTAMVTMRVHDKELDKGDVRLILNIMPNQDFDNGYTDRLKAKLIITNQLVKPAYWNMPLSLYYGAYTKAKHRLCIQIQGFDFPETMDFALVSGYMSYGRMVYNYLLKTPIWDEDTQTWVTADWSPL